MKKLLTILALIAYLGLGAQTYVSGSFSYYDGAGTFGQNSMATIEVGKVIKDVATIGVAAGTTAFSGGKAYLEARPSLTVWSHNNFSISGTLGAGYVFDSDQSFLTEYCGTAGYTFKNNLAVSIFAGGYKFSGRTDFNKYTFTGVGVTYFLPYKK